MRSLLIIFPVAFALAGCAPATTNVYYKQGMTLAVKQRDYDACKIRSFKDIPQNIVIEYRPGIQDPGTVACNTVGTTTRCERVGVMNIPASITNRDANGGLRRRFIDDCMAAKGYDSVEFKNCKDGQAGYNAAYAAPAIETVECYDRRSPEIEK